MKNTKVLSALVFFLPGLFLVISIFMNPLSAWGVESGRTLVNAFGIAAPSSTTLLYGENPAGFSSLSRVKFQLNAGTNNDAANTKYYYAGFYAGNNVFGVGLAGSQYTSDLGNQNSTDLYWGLGGGLNFLALGVSGLTTGGPTSTTSTRFGILLGGQSSTSLGVVLNSDSLATYDFGAGVSYDFSPGVNLALDAYHYRVSGEISYAAGLRLAGAGAELSLGYKMINKNNANEDHLMAGLALNFSQSMSFQYLYNHWLKHVLGLTVRF